MQLLLAAEIISWAILLLPSPPLDPTDTLVLECAAGKNCHYLRYVIFGCIFFTLVCIV